MHMILTHGGLLRQVGGSPLVHLGAYLAAIIHDYEHRGVNNSFLVATGDDLAMTYNDASPMENHHVSAAMRLLHQPRMNFLSGLSAPQKVCECGVVQGHASYRTRCGHSRASAKPA